MKKKSPETFFEREATDWDWIQIKNAIRGLFRLTRKHDIHARVQLKDKVGIYTYTFDPKKQSAKQRGRPVKKPKPERKIRPRATRRPRSG